MSLPVSCYDVFLDGTSLHVFWESKNNSLGKARWTAFVLYHGKPHDCLKKWRIPSPKELQNAIYDQCSNAMLDILSRQRWQEKN